MSERAINAPQGVNARRVEAAIMEKMPSDTWLTVPQTPRLIRAEESRTRARLNRLVREGKIERRRDRGNRGEGYLFRKPSSATARTLAYALSSAGQNLVFHAMSLHEKPNQPDSPDDVRCSESGWQRGKPALLTLA